MSCATLVCMPCTNAPSKRGQWVFTHQIGKVENFHSCIIKEKSFIKLKYNAVGPTTMLFIFLYQPQPNFCPNGAVLATEEIRKKNEYKCMGMAMRKLTFCFYSL